MNLTGKNLKDISEPFNKMAKFRIEEEVDYYMKYLAKYYEVDLSIVYRFAVNYFIIAHRSKLVDNLLSEYLSGKLMIDVDAFKEDKE